MRVTRMEKRFRCASLAVMGVICSSIAPATLISYSACKTRQITVIWLAHKRIVCKMQATFKNFELRQWTLKGGSVVNARVARGAPSAARPALVLLHGFPQTHVMWRRVAQLLEEQYHIILPDLRGYGDSAQPPGAPDHSNYSKRAMAADVVALAGAPPPAAPRGG